MKRTLVVITLAAGFLVGCSLPIPPSPSKSIAAPQPKGLVGKWQTIHGGTMEFRADGSLTMAGPNGSVDITYTLQGNVLEMKKPGAAAGVRHTLESVSEQEAVLVGEDGEKMTLQRVNW